MVGTGSPHKGRARGSAFIRSQWSLLEQGWAGSHLPPRSRQWGPSRGVLRPEAGGVARRPGGQQGGWENSKEVRRSLRSPGGLGGSLGVSEDVG